MFFLGHGFLLGKRNAILMTFSPHLFLDLLHQSDILRVTCQPGCDFSPDGPVEKIEIADEIENLVPDKFIREAQFGVDDLFIIHQDEIVESAPAAQSHPIQHLHILQESEGSGRRNAFLE
jgi:hypothetical protein